MTTLDAMLLFGFSLTLAYVTDRFRGAYGRARSQREQLRARLLVTMLERMKQNGPHR